MLSNKFFTLLYSIVLLTLTACGGSPQTGSPPLGQPVAVQTVARINPSTVQSPSKLQPVVQAEAGSRPNAIQSQNALQQKLGNASPDGDGSITITISDDELTQLIATAQAPLIEQGRTPIFQNAVFIFTNGQIIFNGTIDSDRFSGDAEIVFTPYLTDNVLQLELVSATVDGRPVPPAVLQSIEATINTALQEAFSQLPPSISLDEVTVQEGMLIITGSVER